jgi:Archaea-specific RecJ-like exonuclease, contains DnaJ-type Zn finger domain
MKPEPRPARSALMNEHEIDDRDLTPSNPSDPASLQHPDATLCPECLGAGVVSSGETCPVCEGTGRATYRTGGG